MFEGDNRPVKIRKERLRVVHVALAWGRLDWLPNETWRRDTVPKLEKLGLKPADLRRCVYVIRLNGDYCVDYPTGASPTLYIGEANFSGRINSHRSWVTELEDLVGEFSFQVRIAIPRVTNNPKAYLDTEAALLHRFKHHFGSAPLWNKQFERRPHGHYLYSDRSIDQAICQGSGKRYKWALKPMKSSPFYSDYMRTHSRR